MPGRGGGGRAAPQQPAHLPPKGRGEGEAAAAAGGRGASGAAAGTPPRREGEGAPPPAGRAGGTPPRAAPYPQRQAPAPPPPHPGRKSGGRGRGGAPPGGRGGVAPPPGRGRGRGEAPAGAGRGYRSGPAVPAPPPPPPGYAQPLLPAPASAQSAHHVVFDLDETLVHTSMAAHPPQPNPRLVTVMRPHAAEALVSASKGAEVTVWTAGVGHYARCVLGALDPPFVNGGGGAVDHLIARDPRWFPEHLAGVVPCFKDLRRLGRPLPSTLLIENSPGVVVPGQGKQTVIVPSFVGDPADDVLPRLCGLFECLFASQADSVAEFLACSAAEHGLHRPSAFGPWYMA
eukprot:TRINITY_DN8552_c0_g2_i1.p1 TRINITY_DN8552_c0_g2~~TRINITY_DN8552_c0_g2_i1.p1  ORF type:complete len:366 (+),score=60.27 TRINITY_DN8552_c0_g2_i1:67-1098(+)